MRFYLGVHQANWLGILDVPLFVSHRRLKDHKTLHAALQPWGLDSGGFSELSIHGEWTTRPADYAEHARAYSRVVGKLAFASIQDWMCEPAILQKTGKSLLTHQILTIQNCLKLQQIAPEIPWLPVLQGWHASDYMRHVRMYENAGVELRGRTVGVGSICRRQGTQEAEEIIRELASTGLQLHGFGFKTNGLLRVQDHLSSSDSMAWSFRARKNAPLPGCPHPRCNNCHKYALDWRQKLLSKLKEENRDQGNGTTVWRS